MIHTMADHSSKEEDFVSSIVRMYLPLENDDNYRRSLAAMRNFSNSLTLASTMGYSVPCDFTSRLYEYFIKYHGKEPLTHEKLKEYIEASLKGMAEDRAAYD